MFFNKQLYDDSYFQANNYLFAISLTVAYVWMHVALLCYASKSVVCAVLCFSANLITKRPPSEALASPFVHRHESLSLAVSNKFSLLLQKVSSQSDPAFSSSEEIYNLAKGYFGGTSHTELKPPRLSDSLMRRSLKLELPEIPQVLICEARDTDHVPDMYC